DPDQVLLTGGSMGGHGCWHLATSHPDRFAVLAPQASWPTHQLYVPWFMQRSAIFAEPDQLAQRDAALRSDNVPAMLVNLSNLHAFILHGGMDDNVPTLHGRNFAVWLEELGYQYRYREVPDRKHWWKYEDLDITVCDDTALMAFVRDKRRVTGPRHVRFRTGDLGTTRGAYWVNIDRVFTVGQDAEIEADAGDSVISVSTRNVSEFTLELDQRLFFSGNVHIEVDGRQMGRHFALPALVTLHKDKANWKLGKARLPKLAKTRTLYGPAKQAMFSPFILVYGTQNPELAAYFRHTATQEALRWWLRANGNVEVLPDTEVTAAMVETRNLVLLGGPDANSYTRKIGRGLPIQAKQGHMHLAKRDLGPELAALFVYPNPENKHKLVLVRMGTDPEHDKLSRSWGLVYSGSGVPDFMVFDRTVKKQAWAGVHAAGFFGPDWRFDPQSSYIRE
ncbi:MAG: prolyl oligopeptidase family serine peptidase, partial [candidate division WOR-3 bacterium]